MRFLLSTVLVAVLAFILSIYLPWWGIAVAAFLVVAINRLTPARAFLSGFLGIFALWTILAAQTSSANDGILASRIAAVLPLGGSVFWLIVATSIIGGLVGGLAGLSASFLRSKN